MRGYSVLVWSAIVVLVPAGVASAQSAAAALTAAEIATACAPQPATGPAPLDVLRIVGAQDVAPRRLFGPRDLVVVSGGTQSGVQLGQEYYIRRPYAFGQPAALRPQVVQTVGWLQIVAANDTTAVALLGTTCDAVQAGDHLEPFVPPAAMADDDRRLTPATLDFSALGRVKFGNEERVLAGPGDFMLVDPGSAQLAVGTRVAVYRDLRTEGVPLSAIGEGRIVSLTSGLPLLRIDTARDAVRSGDYVIPHR